MKSILLNMLDSHASTIQSHTIVCVYIAAVLPCFSCGQIDPLRLLFHLPRTSPNNIVRRQIYHSHDFMKSNTRLGPSQSVFRSIIFGPKYCSKKSGYIPHITVLTLTWSHIRSRKSTMQYVMYLIQHNYTQASAASWSPSDWVATGPRGAAGARDDVEGCDGVKEGKSEP